MTIDEAIEYLEDSIEKAEYEGAAGHVKAFKLGIEALKYHKWRRQLLGFDQVPLLPGEREEVK